MFTYYWFGLVLVWWFICCFVCVVLAFVFVLWFCYDSVCLWCIWYLIVVGLFLIVGSVSWLFVLLLVVLVLLAWMVLLCNVCCWYVYCVFYLYLLLLFGFVNLIVLVVKYLLTWFSVACWCFVFSVCFGDLLVWVYL